MEKNEPGGKEIVPFIGGLALWAWDNVIARRKGRTALYTLTGLLLLGGGILSYFIINRIARSPSRKPFPHS
ncbi:MAG: hypothetical protein GX364_07645 [Firmicutes bacterium]|jgi:hypothetical protein|nr:hypothetical protein [Bacillota bacterium]